MSKLCGVALLAGAALWGAGASALELGTIAEPTAVFRDDLWVGGGPQGQKTFLKPMWPGALRCADRIAACSRTFRRSELLTSTNADASANAILDSTGHLVAVGGLVVTERVDADGPLSDVGVVTDWTVGGERTLDPAGTHSWERLIPDASPHAKWLPVGSYRFESDSPAAIPEPATWALFGLGFVALGALGRTRRRQAA